jgi:hypothetical protein
MNRFYFGLSILSFFSLVACVQVETISCGNCDAPPPRQETSDQETVIAGTNPAPFCQLNPSITTVQQQENSAWCWAASTTLVIKHLDPNSILTQCNSVQATLEPEIEAYIAGEVANGRNPEDVVVNCCFVTDEQMRNYGACCSNP